MESRWFRGETEDDVESLRLGPKTEKCFIKGYT